MHAYPSLQSCLTLQDTMDCSPPGPLHMILQARILALVATLFSRGFSWPRDRTRVSCSSCLAGRFFTTEPWGSLPLTPFSILYYRYSNSMSGNKVTMRGRNFSQGIRAQALYQNSIERSRVIPCQKPQGVLRIEKQSNQCLRVGVGGKDLRRD